MAGAVMQFFQGGIKTNRLLVGIKAALTAGAAGIANAVGMGALVGIYTTVAASGTGRMPPWQVGRLALVMNQGANSLTVYSFEGANILAGFAQKVQFASASGALTAGDTGITLANSKAAWFVGSLDPTGAFPVWNQMFST